MKFEIHSHRNALEIAESSAFKEDWAAFREAVRSISDDELIAAFKALAAKRIGRKTETQKSLSHAINEVLRRKLEKRGWLAEPILFSKEQVGSDRNGWRLDFVKRRDDSRYPGKTSTFAVEVAFNHSEAAAWILTKLALACERTVMQKDIVASVGILVVMQADLKKSGSFDSACCTYDRYLHTIDVMHDLLRAPLIVIGLGSPETFKIVCRTQGRRKVGEIVLI
jgi:hypothetical protein